MLERNRSFGDALETGSGSFEDSLVGVSEGVLAGAAAGCI